MIDHVYLDGSRGHEYEIGDHVVTRVPEYGVKLNVIVEIGEQGVVQSLHPYCSTSTYHTTFIYVTMQSGRNMKRLMSSFDPLCEPRKEIVES